MNLLISSTEKISKTAGLAINHKINVQKPFRPSEQTSRSAIVAAACILPNKAHLRHHLSSPSQPTESLTIYLQRKK